MIIQFLNGGLANQVFQYIFARYLELANGGEQSVFLDDSFFFVENVHNGYELEKVFGIQANLLSRQFDEDVWQELIKNKKSGISIPQSFLNMGVNIRMITEVENPFGFNPFQGRVEYLPSANQFYPDIFKEKGDIYYHGYWINKGWLEAYRDTLLKELSFPAIEDPVNTVYAGQIRETESVAVHVRRGDYVTLNWAIAPEGYCQASKMLLQSMPDATFFVFSDDIPWCRANEAALGFNMAKEVVYVEGNVAGKNYIDLYLMTLCKGMLMSNSAFCYLAALMNGRLQYYANPVSFREI